MTSTYSYLYCSLFSDWTDGLPLPAPWIGSSRLRHTAKVRRYRVHFSTSHYLATRPERTDGCFFRSARPGPSGLHTRAAHVAWTLFPVSCSRVGIGDVREAQVRV